MISPIFIWLEVTNRCNANCVYCDRRYIGKLHDMDFNLYKKVVDSCPYAKVIQIQGVGEPLLYPKIVEAVAYAKRKDVTVRFSTNASLLNKDLSLQLLNAGLGEIRFSVDECTKEGYESLRRGLKWETVLENIKTFERLKEEGGYRTKTILRMTRTKENSPRMPEIIAFWEKIVTLVLTTPERLIPPPSLFKNNMFSSGKTLKCKRVWEHLTVRADGTVGLCCRDWTNVYSMGNLVKENVLDVYNSKRFCKIRNAIKTGVNYPTLCNYCKTDSVRWLL